MGRHRERHQLPVRGRWAAGALAALLALAVACAWGLCARWRFYPRMGGLGPWWAYVPPALLALLPAALELAARLRERGRR